MHQHALGQLELEQRGSEARLSEDALDHADQVLLPELARGKVDGDPQPRDDAPARPAPASTLRAAPIRQRNDETRVLGDRNELGRRHEAMLVLRPAKQRLGAAHAARARSISGW
jgi:hypothetical protein